MVLTRRLRRPASASTNEQNSTCENFLYVFQAEPGESFAQIVKEPFCVTLKLEPSDEVISEARDDHVTTRVLFPPLPGPPVKDIVEVHVGEKRRGRPSL